MKKLLFLLPLIIGCSSGKDFEVGDYVKGVPHSNGDVIGTTHPKHLQKLEENKKANDFVNLVSMVLDKEALAVDSSDVLRVLVVDSVLKVESQNYPEIQFWIRKRDVRK